MKMKQCCKGLLNCICIVLIFASVVFAAEKEKVVADLGEAVYTPTRQVVTPHIPWATKYQQGTLRVLFIDHKNKMREVVEFAQRLDMKYDFIGCNGSNASLRYYTLRGGYYLGDEPGEKEERLKVVMENDYDLIVVGNIQWSNLPDFARKAMLEKVKNGAGLIRIVSGHQGYHKKDNLLKEIEKESIEIPEELAQGVPWKLLPVFKKYSTSREFLDGSIRISQYGKGRYVQITGYKPTDMQILSPGFSEDPIWHRWAGMWWFSRGYYKNGHPDIDIPITEIKRLDYDYNLAYLIRLMLYAAKREPTVRVVNSAPLQEIARDNFRELNFPIVTDSDLENVDVEFVMRDRENNVLAQETKVGLKFKKGSHNISFNFENIPAGTYFADLWIKQDGCTVGFGSLAVNVAGKTIINSAKLTSKSFKITEQPVVDIVITSADRQLRRLKLRVRQYDKFNRLVLDKAFLVKKESVTLRLDPQKEPLAVSQSLDIDLLDGREILDRKRLFYTLSDLYLKDTIRLGAWAWPRMSYLQFNTYDELYNNGFDSTGWFFGTIYVGLKDYYGLGDLSTFLLYGRFEMATQANLRFIPAMSRFADFGMKRYSKSKHGMYLDHEGKVPLKVEDYTRHPCLNDPEYIAAMRKRAREVVAHYGPHSTQEYFFDQEPCYSQVWHRNMQEVCYCHYCQDFFHNWLKQEYGTVEKMNAEYKTDYKAFTDVPAVKYPETRTNRSLAPIWTDYRFSQAETFNNFYKNITELIWSIQPNARTGEAAPIYGGLRSSEAVDMAKFSKWMKAIEPYAMPNGQIRLDLAQPDALVNRGCWWGPAHSRSVEFAAYHPWSDLFEGSNWWYCFQGDTGDNLLANDLSLFKDIKVRFDQFHEIKNGIGKLLHSSERQSEIAILYSISSVHHWQLTEGWGDVESGVARYGEPGSEAYRYTVNGWLKLIDEYVGPFRFITYEQLANGYLKNSGIKLLVLPLAQALSDKENEAIKSFVKAGGSVMADMRPGVSDEHCQAREASPLDEVFGVRMNTKAPKIRKSDIFQLAVDDKLEELSKTYADLTLQLNGGKAIGKAGEDVPAIIQNNYGKGKAILFNFIPNYLDNCQTYSKHRKIYSPEASKIAALTKGLMRDASVGRIINFAPEIPRLRHYKYQSGDNLYVGLIQEMPEKWTNYAGRTAKPLSEKFTAVKLDHEGHLYDVRQKRYLGYGDTINTYVTPGIAQVFARLPYSVYGVKVIAPASINQGQYLKYKVQLQASSVAGEHVLRISVKDTEGKEIRHYSKNVTCSRGLYSDQIKLALNEKPGVYTITATEIVSGKQSTVSVVIK